MVKTTSSIRAGRRGDLSDFERASLLGFSNIRPSRGLPENGPKKQEGVRSGTSKVPLIKWRVSGSRVKSEEELRCGSILVSVARNEKETITNTHLQPFLRILSH